jgi:serine/threonine-protein kinase HipA
MDDFDFRAIRSAVVYLRSDKVGILEKVSDEQFSFQYSRDYKDSLTAVSISRSLPLQSDLFLSSKLHPFFDNLIPEGWLLEHAEKIFHIDKTNRFGLLMATGKSPIGAVTVEPLDAAGKAVDVTMIFKDNHVGGQLITYPNQLINRFHFCPTCFNPLKDGRQHRKCTIEMWGTERNIEVELKSDDPLQSFTRVIYGGSVSGAQRKGMFRLEKGLLTSTAIGSQYILKPDGDFPELPLNEHLTMAIAKKCGFSVPPFTLLEIEGLGHVFAIKRFDRTNSGIPLMVEDMGQIIQIPCSDKYSTSCERVAKAISKCTSAPVIDLTDFFRRVLFCYLTANADMHLKNWSILENEKAFGTFVLSPCYDLLNTRLSIPEEVIDIGLPINGRSRNLQKSVFRNLAAELQIPGSQIEKAFKDIPRWAKVAQELVPRSLLAQESKKKYLEIVDSRLAVLS